MAASFISVILGTDELPEPSQIEDGIFAYPWHIDTKYYTTDVNLCSVEKKTLGSEQFAVSVEAVVVNFDSNKVFMHQCSVKDAEYGKCRMKSHIDKCPSCCWDCGILKVHEGCSM
jgi:hypothetical protein